RAVERLAQAGAIDRLEQVVNRGHLETAHGVFVVGRDEGDERHPALFKQSHDPEGGYFRNLPIEQSPGRAGLAHQFNRLRTGPRLADQSRVVKPAQHRGEKRTRRAFIVGDHDAQSVVHPSSLLVVSAATATAPPAKAVTSSSGARLTGGRNSTVAPT